MIKNVVIVVLLVLLALQFIGGQVSSSTELNLKHLEDENKVLGGTVKDLRSLNETRDTLIRRLIKEVDRGTETATVFVTRVYDSIQVKTDTVVAHDTVAVGDTVYVYPQYSTFYEDQWLRLGARMNRDTSMFEYAVRNQIVVKQQWKRDGLLRPKYLEVEITNDNPHALTIDKRSFRVQQPKKNRLLWGLIGFGVGVGTVILVR